jgi:hypothetical protein
LIAAGAHFKRSVLARLPELVHGLAEKAFGETALAPAGLNPVPPSGRRARGPRAAAAAGSGGEQVAAWAPGARVVKIFNPPAST